MGPCAEARISRVRDSPSVLRDVQIALFDAALGMYPGRPTQVQALRDGLTLGASIRKHPRLPANPATADENLRR